MRCASSSVVPTGTVTRPSFVITSLIGRWNRVSNRRSRFVRMPPSRPFSVIGTPERLTRRLKFSCRSNIHPMALFEFLSAAAGAGIVPSDFGAVALRLVLRSIAVPAGLLGHQEFGAPPFALDLLGLFLFFYRLEQEE